MSIATVNNMILTAGLDLSKQELSRQERKARYIAAISTAVIATILLLVLILIHLITPIPPLPPDPEMMVVEVGITDGSGGDAAISGGGSNGNTGTPGTQTAAVAAHDQVKTPADNGSVTDNNSDNASATSSNHNNPTSQQQTVSNDVLAALANWKKNKGAASINIGGDGSGNPYTGGIGNGSGTGVGPNTGGDQGTGKPGGDPHGNENGKYFRHILFKPEIVNPTQEEGKVVVKVYVDRSGKVTKAEVDPSGTTTINSVLLATAKQSAYQIKFDADASGPDLLVLPIDIYFTLK